MQFCVCVGANLFTNSIKHVPVSNFLDFLSWQMQCIVSNAYDERACLCQHSAIVKSLHDVMAAGIIHFNPRVYYIRTYAYLVIKLP